MRPITSLARVALRGDALEGRFRLPKIGRRVCQPPERRISIGDDSSERLIDLMSYRCRELAHRGQSCDAREFGLRLVYRRVGANAFGFVHRYADILDHIPGLFERRLTDAVKVLERPIAQHCTKWDVIGSLFLNRAYAVFLERGSILRMDQIKEQLVGELRRRGIEAEDAPLLLRPKQFASLYIPSPTAGMAELFRLRQISCRPTQIALSPVTIGDIDCRGEIDGGLDSLPGMDETKLFTQIEVPSLRR